MADTKISALSAQTVLEDANEFVLADSGASKKITGANLRAGLFPAPATSLPGSPVNGQPAILVDSTTNPSYQWMFRFNTSGSGSYDWEFIGGAPAYARIDTQEGTTSGSYADLSTAGPSFTVPCAGDYVVSFGAWGRNSGGDNAATVGLAVNGSVTTGREARIYVNSGTKEMAVAHTCKPTGLAASDELKLMYSRLSSGTAEFQYRWISVMPVRVA